jgi:hypothetical protein
MPVSTPIWKSLAANSFLIAWTDAARICERSMVLST